VAVAEDLMAVAEEAEEDNFFFHLSKNHIKNLFK
jgi:hypothetical protein